MRTQAFSFLFAGTLFFLLGLTACQSTGAEGTETENMEDSMSTDETTENPYTLTAFTPSTAYPDATISGYTYTGGKFAFKVSGETYQLGAQTPDAPQKMCANSAEGQHIHLIINDAPYAAKYEAAFDYEIPDGEHYLLAFLSRSYHESIKTAQAHTAQKITVAANSQSSAEPITEPMLFYSRPKGTYVGKANTDKVMLDFYLVNAALGSDYMVQVEINGEQTLTLDQWQPYYIEGLPMGDNKIKLTLLDKDGAPVNTPLNPVERVFTLKEDPAEGQ